jgi:hypothetical protein
LSQIILTTQFPLSGPVTVRVVLDRLTAHPPAAMAAVVPTGEQWHFAPAVTVAVHEDKLVPSTSVHVVELPVDISSLTLLSVESVVVERDK